MNALEFDRLVQKYQSLVYTICRQLVADEGYAQDLTQETFLAAWRSMDRCPAGYEKQWLARIASNKAKDILPPQPPGPKPCGRKIGVKPRRRLWAVCKKEDFCCAKSAPPVKRRDAFVCYRSIMR